MAKFYYDKYKIETIGEWIKVIDNEFYNDDYHGQPEVWGYKSYTIGRDGTFIMQGEPSTVPELSVPQLDTRYSTSGGFLKEETVARRGDTKYSLSIKTFKSEYKEYNTKGDYIETIIANDGEYPNNGVKGYYWYIKQNEVKIQIFPRIGGQVKRVESGKIRIGGELKDVLGIWIRVDGKLKGV